MESTPTLLDHKFEQLSLNPTTTNIILIPAGQNKFFPMPTSSQEYDNMLRGPQIDGNEVVINRYEEMTEGENDDENYDDDLYVPPSNFETTVKETFFHELSTVSSFQTICYFNGAGSYAIPHRGDLIQLVSQNIVRILEWWLTEKLSHTGETIPILEESPQISAVSIMSKLREASSALNGLSKVLINIRAGHVYLLHMIDDEVVMNPNCERFFQQFPLFVNVSITVQEHTSLVRHNTCQVLVAVEHVTMKDANQPVSCKYSQNHSFTNTRVTSSPDAQTFCLLEEVATR